MNTNFDTQLETFMNGLTDMLNKHQNSVGTFKNIQLHKGRKYIKVEVGGSAFCFIDKTNGDVLKPASWSAPAKHARGNIFDNSNGLKYVGPYGPAYLRG